MATSLIKSISDGNAKRLSKLLRHRAGLKLTLDDMSTSLFIAIKQSREECVSSLLNAGTDANSSDTDGKPAIFLVMEYGRGNPVILKSLLRAGANPDKVTYNTQQTALHAAARKGYQVCIKSLLLAGATADKPDGHGNTALMYAAREGHITILRTMLQENSDPNARNNNGETALHLAVKGNRTLCIEELLCQGASTDICDNKGQNVLLLALKSENYQLIDFLIENNCSVNAQDTHSGKTVLHWAVQNGNVELVVKLLQLNADPNVRDKDWQTPFLLALNMDKPDILEHLLKAGCNISVTDRSFNTALHIASTNGQARMLPLLISRGLAVDLKGSGGMTPLMLAALGGHEETVYMLLEYGANSSLTDRNHASALVYAILSIAKPSQIHNIVMALIRSNCDVNYAANLLKVTKTFSLDLGDGVNIEERLYTPLEISFLKGDPAVFMMLLRSGCDASKFCCDRDMTLRNFKSVHSDLKNRWILLRCINKERKRLKPLKELCRRPVLQTFKYNIENTINVLPVSEDLRGFLNFSDLEGICQRYAGDYVEKSSKDHSSPSVNSQSKKIYQTNSLNRNKLRSTIHYGFTRERTPKSPTTPILPKATWDDEIKQPNKKNKSPKLRTASFSDMPVTERPQQQRTVSTSGVPSSPDVLSPIDVLSPSDVLTETKSKSIFDFLRKSKPKHVDGKKGTKARSKKAKDPRDTISLLLHGSNSDYHTSGEITPKPLDIEAIEKLSETSPKQDYESVNRMLYGSSYKTPDSNIKDFEERVQIKRADITQNINNVGVENYINTKQNGNSVNFIGNRIDQHTSHGPIRSEDIPDEFFLYSEHDNEVDITPTQYESYGSVNNYPASTPNSTKLKMKSKNGQLQMNCILYDNEPNTNESKDQPEVYCGTGSKRSNQNENSRVRRSHSFTGYKPCSKASVSSDSQFSANSYEDSENNLQMDIANMAINISSTFKNLDKVDSHGLSKTRGPTGSKYTTSNTRPSIKVTHHHDETLPLSPTSTTSKSSLDSNSSVGMYKFPTGDAQLLHKYLHSQSSEYTQTHKQQKDTNPRPITLDIFSRVGDLNGNNIDDTMSQSSFYSNLSCDSRSEQGKKMRTSSVSSLSSSDSRRSPSKIPVLQHPWSPQPVRSKIPVPSSPVLSPSSRSNYGRFLRSKSFRKY